MKTEEDLITEINKKYGKGTIKSLDDLVDAERISTGSLKIDNLIGGGIPRGHMTEIYGTEYSGKTTLSLQTIANAQRQGIRCLYILVEQVLDKNYALSLGVNQNPDNQLIITQPNCGEDVIGIAKSFCESGTIGVIVLDSVAAMTSHQELEGNIGDANMGVRARIMNQAVRVLMKPVVDNNVAMIFVNQIRQNLSGYGGKSIPGGKALGYGCTIILDLTRVKKEEGIIEVKATVEKNKIGIAPKTTLINVFFNKGTSIYREMVDVGLEKKLWIQGGAWISGISDQKIQGVDKATAYFEELEKSDNKSFQEYLEKLK
jgi:recombination protein RecA